MTLTDKANGMTREVFRRRVLDKIQKLRTKKEALEDVLHELDVAGEIDEKHKIEDMKNFARDRKRGFRGSTTPGSSYLSPLRRPNHVVTQTAPHFTNSSKMSPLPLQLKPGNNHVRSRSTG